MPDSNYTNTELKQYLLDFETGEILEYDSGECGGTAYEGS